jgi:hypothetical protein
MASVAPHIKVIPSETSYFINLANMATNAGNPAATGSRVFNYNPAATAPVFSTATWACNGVTSSILQTAGAAILKDLGRTVVSSLRTFRKVQLVVSSISSGVSIGAPVASQAGSGNNPVTGEEYFTGYIEVVGQFGTNVSALGNIAPVARLG